MLWKTTGEGDSAQRENMESKRMTNPPSESSLAEYFYALLCSDKPITRFGPDELSGRLRLLSEGYVPVEEFFRLRGRRISRQRLSRLKHEGRIDSRRRYGRLWVAPQNNWLPMHPWQSKAARFIDHRHIIAVLESEVRRLEALRSVCNIAYMEISTDLKIRIREHKAALSL